MIDVGRLLIGRWGRNNSRATIVRHVLGQHREVGWGWELFAEATIEVKVCFKQWVIAYVRSETGPVIGIGQVDVVAMDDVHVPTHQVHLKSKDRWIIAIVQENESDSIAVGDPDKTRAEQHMTILVDGPVASEALA